jgi:hypothetical protein
MGDHLDIGSVYAGRFSTAWTTARRQDGTGPQKVEILCNSIAHANENADVLFWRGAAVITLTDALEAAGYMVKIVVGFGGKHWNPKGHHAPISCRITVRDFGMPMDTATAASVVLPGFFRGLGHQWIVRRAPYESSNAGISVGQSKIEPGEFVCSHETKDLKTAQAWITKTIATIEGRQEVQASA